LGDQDHGAERHAWAYGFTGAARDGPGAALGLPMALYLHDVNVDPSVQRRGVGRQLIEHAKIVAREWPASAIRLDAYDGPGGGGAFYTKCGFAEVGHTVYRNVPLVYFELLLPDDGRSRSG
jgi:GNAT superfamily N-acetyltransferase